MPISGVVAQSVGAPNSNSKVVSSIFTLELSRCCVLEKTLNANNPNRGGAAQWVRAKVANRKIV